ncbi:pilin [Streptomyces caniscabiei]|uniref:pilin n=1 Tax=Streptomyces caniscabiei TaxID=2746961 RepID=UPI0029BB4903|nr:pilin [Streptomyces caniscabiei]MDX2776378.1 pilin [Streptomyces caniscabiei]
MKKIAAALITLTAIVGVASFVPSPTVNAAPVDEIQRGVNASGGDEETNTLGARFEDIVNVMLYILGAIAVIMIVIGGIRYATSGGDSSSIKGAKDTILYAVIGLIVAILAYAIVNFVLDSF